MSSTIHKNVGLLRNTGISEEWSSNANSFGSEQFNKREEEGFSESPVDLVKRVKSERLSPEVIETSELSTSPSYMDSLAMSAYFMRRKRRGRCRYPPFYIQNFQSRTQGSETNVPAFVNKTTSISNSSPSTNSVALTAANVKSFRGQFTCPNCPMLFSNRDALAMHMMDSVRGQGCPGQNNPVSTASSSNNNLFSQSSSAANENRSIKSRNNSATSIPSSSTTKRSNLNIPTYSCRICGEQKGSLDSLAMHMLSHAHQEQLKETESPKSIINGSHISNSFPQLSTEKGGHIKLPMPSLCFNPIEFSNVQQAFNLALATMSAAASSERPLASSLANTFNYNRMNSAKEIIRCNELSSPVTSPPKCHSVPIINNYSEYGNMHNLVDDLTPTGSEKAEYKPFKSRTNIPVLSCDLLEDDSDTKVKDINGMMSNSNFQNGAANVMQPHMNEGLTDIDKEYEGEGSFPGLRQRGYYYACHHCRMTFEDRTIFCLHMGLHNVNNPWQCNMCRKVCSGLHEFASHALHF